MNNTYFTPLKRGGTLIPILTERRARWVKPVPSKTPERGSEAV